jgi:translocation and assembly module TamB
MLRKLPKITLWALGALLSVAVLAFLFLVYTQAGLRFAVRMLPEKMGMSRVQIRNVQGALAGGFTLEYFELHHPRATVKVDKLKARIDVLPLLWQTIEVRDAKIERAFVQVYTRRTPPKRQPRFLPPFLTIRAEGTQISNATLIATNGRRFDGTEVAASGTLRSKTLRFYDARARLQDLRVQGALEFGAAEYIRLNAQTHWKFSPAGQPVWTASIDADGDLASLEIVGQITAPFRARFNGSADALATSTWHWGGKGLVDEFDLRAWGGGGVLGKITGQLALKGDRNGFSATGPLQSAGLKVGDFDLRFDGSYANRVITARRILLVHRSSKARIDGVGDIGIASGGPRLALLGSWRDFRWPLAGAVPGVRSSQGEYRLDGVWPYALRASGPLQIGDFAPIGMRIEGSLGRDRLQIISGALAMLGGSASVRGDAIWSPKYQWQLAGAMQDMDTAQLRAALPGRVSFEYQASGDGYGGGEDLNAEFRNLSGRVRGAAARGSGKIQRRGSDWHFDRIRLAAGGLGLDLDGVIGPIARDLKFSVTANDLAILAPGSRGKLRASGNWRGPNAEPVIEMQASGRDVVYGDLQVAEIDAKIDLDPRARQRSTIDLRARDMSVSGRRLQRLSFSLDGPAEASVARLEAQMSEIVLRSSADGAFSGGAWRGRWRSIELDNKKALHLKLTAPASIAVNLDSGRFERFCLRGAAAQVCPEASWDATGWHTALSAMDLPLDALTAGLTAKVIYDGTIGGELELHNSGGSAITGEVRARLRDARLRRLRTRGREDVLALGSGDLALDIDSDRLRGTLKLDAGNLGFVDGSLTATRRGGGALDYRDWPLQAQLRAESRTLSFLSLLSQDIDRVGGKMTLDLGFGGTLGAPRADGRMRLTEGELDLYAINLAVRQLTAGASVAANRLVFDSTSKVGAGALTADGSLYWEQGLVHGQLRLKGTDLLAVDVPEARILASPDLLFKMDGRRIEVSGEVKLPVARIAPADLAGAVLASNDEVLADQPVATTGSGMRVATSIRMTLGDQVTLDTFGLSGRLTGSILTRSAEDGSTHANGELNVAEGKYAAFGRRLDIERGRLQFGGGLVSDPAIDIRATKQYPEVIAGVNVRGTLQAPRMTFFSTPSLPQSQIVSLILAGGNIDRAQDPTRTGAARSELLAQGGAIIAQQLGSRVGVDDVSIEQALDNSTSLVLGKYLSPHLYVSYGISLAESINTIKLRYALDDRWTIRTEAGKERSAELVYTIEK